VLFVKVKAFLLDLGWSSASAAARYDHWMAHRVRLFENLHLSIAKLDIL